MAEDKLVTLSTLKEYNEIVKRNYYSKNEAEVAISAKLNNLSTVAKSGSFNDLADKPEFVKPIEGKGLSSNDFSDKYKNDINQLNENVNYLNNTCDNLDRSIGDIQSRVSTIENDTVNINSRFADHENRINSVAENIPHMCETTLDEARIHADQLFMNMQSVLGTQVSYELSDDGVLTIREL